MPNVWHISVEIRVEMQAQMRTVCVAGGEYLIHDNGPVKVDVKRELVDAKH